MEKINLAEKLTLFSDHWSPKIVASIDDYEVKLVKVQGDFIWHTHDDADEMFMVISGALDMDYRDKRVTLLPGELVVVPKGVEHKPHAENECEMLLLERKGLVNTGDADVGELTANVERI